MTKINRNDKLCGKSIQSRLIKAIDILDSESLMYAIRHNMIECVRVTHALRLLKELRTNRRVSTLYNGGIIK